MSEPIDHHYVPVFYLSRWAGTDGCVCRFGRPYGTEVKAKRVVPKGTGFEPRLYSSMEQDFMAKLDTEAAEALELIERALPEREWTSRIRTGWSRFLLTQLLRAPEDIAQLKSSVREEWAKRVPELEQKAIALGMPETERSAIGAYIEQQQDEIFCDVARTIMDHPRACQLLNGMHWLVLDVGTEYPLFTSDRPIWMTAALTEDDACLLMPIGPRKIFAATATLAAQQKLIARRRVELAKVRNKLVVQHAVKYVYSQTDRALSFVQKHMGTKRHSSLLEQVAATQGNTITAPDSPLAKR
jgi:hypothetical protein